MLAWGDDALIVSASQPAISSDYDRRHPTNPSVVHATLHQRTLNG